MHRGGDEIAQLKRKGFKPKLKFFLDLYEDFDIFLFSRFTKNGLMLQVSYGRQACIEKYAEYAE